MAPKCLLCDFLIHFWTLEPSNTSRERTKFMVHFWSICTILTTFWTLEPSNTSRERTKFMVHFWSICTILTNFWTLEPSNTSRERTKFRVQKGLQQTDRRTDGHRTNTDFGDLYTIAPSGQLDYTFNEGDVPKELSQFCVCFIGSLKEFCLRLTVYNSSNKKLPESQRAQ